MHPLAILIGGPTASRKTQLAFEIQKKFPSYIINADSMQVYDELKTLTNMPTNQELKEFACNLFGFIKYPKKCDVGFWYRNVKNIVKVIKGKVPIFVGGTGLYLDSLNNTLSPIPKISMKTNDRIEKIHSRLGNTFFYKKLQKIDKEYSKIISRNDSQRLIRSIAVKIATRKNVSYWHNIESKKVFKKTLFVVITSDRKDLYKSIDERCSRILRSSTIDEVKNFLKKKKTLDHPLHKSIGLRSIENYINGESNLEETLQTFSQDTRRYAKRQITWFKNRSKDATHLEFSDAKKFLLRNI